VPSDTLLCVCRSTGPDILQLYSGPAG